MELWFRGIGQHKKQMSHLKHRLTMDFDPCSAWLIFSANSLTFC